MTIVSKIDYRLGGIPRYCGVPEEEIFMQIPDEIRKCVIFVLYKDTEGIRLAGTAFLVGVPFENTDWGATYLITAKHIIDVIEKKCVDGKVYLRLNTKQGSSAFYETPITDWKFHPEDKNVDVAIFPWTPPRELYDYRILPLDMAATEEILTREEINIGDEVFLTGLFANHFGSKKNIPIIRVGNIAAMPEEKVHTSNLGDIDAYLIEARSIGGLSGSPVFVYTSPFRKIGDTYQMARESTRVFYWLGIIHGHFDLSTLALDGLVEDSITNLQVNMGIAIVIPVWKILEVINQDVCVKEREMALKKIKDRLAPVAD